jgi:hypothetical protein
MKFEDLGSIDWDAFESTADWTKLLNDLIDLAQTATGSTQRDEIANRLDEFADHSSSEDLDIITKLDRVARKCARALRMESIGESVKELQTASADFRVTVKELSAATATLKKEALLLRAEKFNAAVSSLTGAIASLKALSQATAGDDDEKLAVAIAQAVSSAQKLRGLLERPA